MSLSTQRNEGDALLEGNFYTSTHLMERKRNIRFYLMTKRAIDIIGAAVGLVLLSPLFFIVAILIKMEDPKGPVFFQQTRVGKHQRAFRMYKFRSMVSNAEELLKDLLAKNEIQGAMFKMKDDPRITRIGKFIRRTSIDELPQLWNVIRGDMSLVGPRPPLPREVEEYTTYDKRRLLVQPGCTGLWQVSGRNNLGFSEMVELDITYIRERTLFYDFKIILKTIRVLFGAKDAF
ncbi:Sugar transferase involved in LPS biosynthesis (colanic, teichoic acid) [Paenibacillus sp. UNC496MF]|uniref:sugar transferase n=1 Tax=Paenibacillus sp. UNC496MF TaxID=1502753 RepID=UPI0008E4B465|nr:sugar transferase [Paenibacillus sp. UNC496MF]SFI88445.1 Sugar transferase involved in LPS biosynthesis (colanic, teichoic acid) [Paenibacillus sp. UNC496MF]